jgi:hypothetical protein
MLLALATWLMPAALAQNLNDQHAAVESDVLLLQIVVDDQPMSEVLGAYQSDRDVLLPLGELARLLTLAITTQPGRGTASGYILKEERVFALDLAQSSVVVDGKRELVDLHAVEQRSDDIYVPSRLLARWLPIDIDVDMSGLLLQLRTREHLPMQFRLEREAQAARLGTRTPEAAPQYPHYSIPYRTLAWPLIDQTLSIDYARSNASRDFSGRYSAYATADLLGMQGELYVDANSGTLPDDVRLTLGRYDPDAGLLGPLRARTAAFGNIPVPAEENISRTNAIGEGLLISNRPLSQPTSFSQHSLVGPLPPGWDVELYFNDVLIGFQSATPDGLYRFEDQPLLFGNNEFRLVFHGPLGQVRVERENFLLDRSATAPGEVFYSLAQQHDKQGNDRSLARFDWGLTEHLSASGGLVRAPVAGISRDFVHAGLQSYWHALLLSGEAVKSQDGSLYELAVRTRLGKWSINASQAQLQNFTSELFLPSSDPVRANTRLRVDGALTFTNIRLPITVEGSRELHESGASTLDLSSRISARVHGTLASGQVHWNTVGGQDQADTTLQLSRGVSGLSLRGEVNYRLEPRSRLATVALSADRRLGKGYLQTFNVTRRFDSSETLYSTGLSKILGSFGLGLNAGYSSNSDISASLQFFLALGREPRGGGWQFDAQPLANSGGVSAQVFLDDNMNGRRDAGEEPIQGVAFTVNGGRYPLKTDADGVVYLSRLPPLQHTDIAVVPETLEDPHWLPQVKGVQLVPRPGTIATLDIAVLRTSEIEGTVYLTENGRRQELGSVVIEVVDRTGHVIATSTSGADGYYVLAGVPAGEYVVRVAAAQPQLPGLQYTAARLISVARDGWLVSEVDLELKRALTP